MPTWRGWGESRMALMIAQSVQHIQDKLDLQLLGVVVVLLFGVIAGLVWFIVLRRRKPPGP